MISFTQTILLITHTSKVLMPCLTNPRLPSKKYIRSLFRGIKSAIETEISIDQEPCYHDQLMELLVQHITQVSDVEEEDAGFVTYRTERGNQVNLSIYRSHNQVGTRIWSAGIFLSELFIKISSCFHQKVLCELGSGVGVSLIYLAGCNPSHYPKTMYLTDYPTDVLELLKQNINNNKMNYNGNTYCLAYLLPCLLTALLTYCLVYLLPCLLTALLTYSLIHLLVYSSIHSLTHSLTHSLRAS